jgi:hypothetical protein
MENKIDELMRQIRNMITPQPTGITVTMSLGLWRRLVYRDLKVTTLNKRQRLKRVAMRKGRK